MVGGPLGVAAGASVALGFLDRLLGLDGELIEPHVTPSAGRWVGRLDACNNSASMQRRFPSSSDRWLTIRYECLYVKLDVYESKSIWLNIIQRVWNPGFPEPLLPQEARVAMTTRPPRHGGVVAGCGQGEVEAQAGAEPDDVCLGQAQERGADPKRESSLDAGLGSQVGRRLERFEELRPAVGIARVVEGIGADEYVAGSGRLAPGDRVREKEGVAGRDIGNRDRLTAETVARNLERSVGQGRRAAGGKVQTDDPVLAGAVASGQGPGPFELNGMSLAVVEGERKRLETVFSRQQETCGRVEPAGEEDDSSHSSQLSAFSLQPEANGPRS